MILSKLSNIMIYFPKLAKNENLLLMMFLKIKILRQQSQINLFKTLDLERPPVGHPSSTKSLVISKNFKYTTRSSLHLTTSFIII